MLNVMRRNAVHVFQWRWARITARKLGLLGLSWENLVEQSGGTIPREISSWWKTSWWWTVRRCTSTVRRRELCGSWGPVVARQSANINGRVSTAWSLCKLLLSFSVLNVSTFTLPQSQSLSIKTWRSQDSGGSAVTTRGQDSRERWRWGGGGRGGGTSVESSAEISREQWREV